ncbi:hypothetical protein GCM10027168_57120 [Streptomyces capparidis]
MAPKPEIGELIRKACRARGWGPAKLARELGIAEGRGPTGLDRQSVRRWMVGERKPEYWLPYLVRVLDLDLDDDRAPECAEPSHAVGDTVAALLELGRSDVQRRSFLAATSAYPLGVLNLPEPDGLLRRTDREGTVRVGMGEVAAVRQMTRVLGDAAAELGGGHARHLAVRYLTDDVAPWLDGRYTERTGRELFAAASQLVHLAGWTAQDEGNQGLAQRYYAHAYRLGVESGEPEVTATALRGLAVQAIDLGHGAVALRLAEKCIEEAGSLDDPRARAYYGATLAEAAALDGDRGLATRSLTASRAAIEKTADAPPGDSWASHFSVGRWAHYSGLVLARLGDLRGATEHLRQALDIHGIDRRRSRAIVLAHLGQVHLRQGDLDAALSAWTAFVDSADGLRSVKIDDAAQDMCARLDRYRKVPEAGELRQRAETLAAERAAT